MRVSRLFVSHRLCAGQNLDLDADGAHYVRTVLRLKKDDHLIVFDGEGGEHSSVLTEVSRNRVSIAVGQTIRRSVESPLQLVLGLGISRGDRMDWSVQKAVELGVNEITPIVTERCVVQLKGEKKQQRLQHWQKIIQHAAEQSGRTLLPELRPVTSLYDWLADQEGLKVLLDPYANRTLSQVKPDADRVTLLTGPEGGFADHERDRAVASGFVPVRLGTRILRTETASLAALAAIQTLWGDFADAVGTQK